MFDTIHGHDDACLHHTQDLHFQLHSAEPPADRTLIALLWEAHCYLRQRHIEFLAKYREILLDKRETEAEQFDICYAEPIRKARYVIEELFIDAIPYSSRDLMIKTRLVVLCVDDGVELENMMERYEKSVRAMKTSTLCPRN
jgi:hypothetical protein